MTAENIISEEMIMTDFQFKTVLRMAKKVVRAASTKEEAEKELDMLIAGEEPPKVAPPKKVVAKKAASKK